MSIPNQEKERAGFLEAVAEMYDELRQWREKHPEASFDEIAGQVTPRRRELMGHLMGQLACQHGAGEAVEGLPCPDCGGVMIYKGRPKRDVAHLEGETRLERAYYYCVHCESGLFPPRRQVAIGGALLDTGNSQTDRKTGDRNTLVSSGGAEL
ncbi:MAG: hypothetical protein R3264_13080 [Anaerolineae bacterium]|nr:hypothetical protein [Anaerolineae bacterium]